jgi:hypothetical protein
VHSEDEDEDHINPDDGGDTFLQNTVTAYRTTWCHNPEDHKLHLDHHKNLKSQIIINCTKKAI